MCDYSLMMIPNRLAVEGEHLITHKFKSGSTGLVSVSDIARCQLQEPVSFWRKIRDCFSSQREPSPVVCMPPGARLSLDDIPCLVRTQFNLGSFAEATFTQISAEVNRYRDALRFSNGITVPLQFLPAGLTVTVLELPESAAAENNRRVEVEQLIHS